MIKVNKSLKTTLIIVSCLLLLIFSTYVFGDTAAYNLTFSNDSQVNLSVNQSQNATYIITITNNNESNRSYNLSVDYGYINTSQINLTGYNSTNISFDVWNATNRTIFSIIYATVANNGSIVLNSSDDMGLIMTTVLDSVAPTISNISNYSITNQSATVSLNTDESTNKTVFYGTSTGNYSLSAINDSYYAFSQIYLTGLLANTLYFYVINASDISGNLNLSSEYNFTTLQTAVTDSTDPIVNLNSPINGYNSSSAAVTFNCSVVDETNLTNVSLFGNWSGGWHANVSNTSGVNNTAYVFSVSSIVDGTYAWNCEGCDNSTNCAFNESNRTFTVDTIYPQILNVSNSSITNQSATVNWTTGESANMSVMFGIDISLSGGSNSSAAYATSHSLALYSLANSTLYYYNVTSCDYTGNCNTSGPYNFTTAIYDTTPPTISAVINKSISNSSVEINWTTDESSNSSVKYGTDTTLATGTNESASTVVGHSLSIYGLNDNTLYYYNVSSCDASGNCDEDGPYNFTTLSTDTTAPLVALNSPIDGFNSTSGAVTFNCTVVDAVNLTNVSLFGNWSGGWHANVSNTSGVNNTAYVFSVSGIADGTYAWNCEGCDNSTNCAFNASNRTFTVDTIYPQILNVSNSSITNQSALITWNTDESANSSVMYGINTTLSGGSNSSATLSTSYSLAIYSLTNFTLYYYNVTSCDYAGNCNTSGPYNFTTQTTADPDSTDPIVVLNSPIDAYNTTSNSNITFNCTVRDAVNLTNVTLFGNWSGGWHANVSNTSGVNNTAYLFSVGTFIDGTYAWNCEGCDNSTNCAFNESNRTFTVDTIYPQITNITNASTLNTSTRINWTTQENANSSVVYGINKSLTGGSNSSATLTTDHGLALYNLSNGTLYYYNVTSCDYLGNCNTSGPNNFTTSNPDMTPPAISTVINYTITNQSVIINWTTDESANSSVRYGTDTTLAVGSNGSDTTVTTHSLALYGLSNGTLYYYNVSSCDADNNCDEDGPYNFTTTNPDYTSPSVILNIPLEGYNSTSQIVEFNCSVLDTVNLTNVTLYGNWSSGWHANSTNESGVDSADYMFSVTIADGLYAWNCYACDNTSNCAFNGTNQTLRIDSTAPTVNISYPGNSTNLSAGTTWTWINITTDESALCRYNLTNASFAYADGISMNTSDNLMHYYNFTNGSSLSDTSNYTIYYLCNDTYGTLNSASTKHIFYVNDTPGNPVINSITLSDNITTNNTAVMITVNVTKGTADLLYVSASGVNLTNQSDPSAAEGLWNYTINLTTGNSPISVVAMDVMSINDTDTSATYAIDDVAPQISFTLPVSSANISDTNYTVVYVITDSYFVNATYTHNLTVNGSINSTSGSFDINLTAGLSQYVNITALDEAGNTNTSSVAFSVDFVAPNSSANYSETDWKNYSVIVTVSSTDTGITTGIMKQYYCVNQDAFNCTNFTEGNQTTISVDGNNTMRYFAQDFAENNGTIQNLSVLIDKTYPVFISSPVDQYNTSAASIIFNWTITETNMWIANWSINDTFRGDITLVNTNDTTVSEGLNQNVTYFVCDLAGNCNSSTRYFHVDRIAPNISNNWTEQNSWVNYSLFHINLTATDNAQGVGVEAIIWCASTGTCVLNIDIPGNSTLVEIDQTYPDGNYTLSYIARDFAGVSTTPTQETTVLLDRTSPIVNATLPANNSNISAHNLTITWTTIDANFQNMTFSINGTQRTNLSENGTYVETNITSGLNQNITFHILDMAGNGNTSIMYFNVDWLAPNTTADYTNNTDYVNYTVLINFTSNDSFGVGVEHFYSCIGNGPSNTSCTPTTTGNSSNVTLEGVNYIRYYAVDYAGNNESYMNLNSSAHIRVAYIDMTGPTISTDYTAVWTNEPYIITLNTTDAYSGPNRTYHYLEGSSLVQTNHTANASANTTTISINSSGNRTLTYYGYDNIANLAVNQTINVLFDNQSPNATINALPEYSQSLSINITYNATDYNLSGVDRVYVYYRDANDNTSVYSLLESGTSSPIGGTLAVAGNYTFFVNGQDNVGNNQTNDTNYNTTTLMDATDPSLNLTYPSNGLIITANFTNVTWQVADTFFANLTIRIDNGTYVLNTTSGYVSFTNLAPGFHSVFLKAQDLAGNSVVESVNFTIEAPLNMSEFLSTLDTVNTEAYNFNAFHSSNYALNYTTNQSVNVSAVTVDLQFYINFTNTSNSTHAIVALEDFPALSATYSVYFNATTNDTQIDNSITLAGYTPQLIVTVNNVSQFITNQSAYHSNVTLNITNIAFDYVYHCTSSNINSCTFISNCTSNNFTGISDLSCYTIDGSDWISVYTESFSSIAVVLDNIMAVANVTSPDNTTNITSGSNVYFNFTIGEVVRGNYSFDGQPNVSISVTQDYSSRLNGTFNSTHQILANGAHNITAWLWDNSSYNDTFTIEFNVSDYYVPTISSIIVSGNTTTGSTGTALIQVTTDEYTYCWYAQADNTLIAATSDLSLYSQASSGALATVHNITHSYTSTRDEAAYYVTCQDAMRHNMTTNSNSGSFRTTYSYTAPPGGGGGGGGGGSTTPPTVGPQLPANWGLYNDLYWDLLMPDTPERRDVRVNRLAIRNITLTTIQLLNRVNVRVVELLSLPADVPVVFNAWENKPVYQYLSLVKSNITDRYLKEVLLDFEVSKFWIGNNKANISKIKLFRYSDVNWVEVPTRQVQEDADYVYFRSQSPGLSYFAIVATAKITDSITPPVIDVNETPEIIPHVNETPEVEMFNDTVEPEQPEIEVEPEEKERSYLWVYILISVVTFLVIMYVVLYKYYKWKHRYF